MKNRLNEITPQQYQKMADRANPPSRVAYHCLMAFLVGGLICVVGQVVSNIGKALLQLDKESASAFTAIVMVFLGATLTGIGIYDRIGSVAGAGSIVPITGFANSIVAPAIEFKQEGYIMGTGSRMFNLAGPVLVYGISASIVGGLLYYLLKG
ncbi:MAG: stage V sporulation protein AC [Christensenellales bacterium]|jgi:stage V sporulation protein AC